MHTTTSFLNGAKTREEGRAGRPESQGLDLDFVNQLVSFSFVDVSELDSD